MIQDNVLKKKSEWSDTKKEFVSLIRRQGYRSVRQFSIACGIDVANVNSNLNGKFYVSINRLFVYANALGVAVEEVIRLFYPEEVEKNRDAITNHEAFLAQFNKEETERKPGHKMNRWELM